MAQFTIEGQEYLSGKLNVMQQFHVSRKLMPVLGSAASIARSMAPKAIGADGEPDEQASEVALVAAIPMIAEAIAKLTDADCDFVIFTCMSVVQRKVQQSGSWAAVTSQSARRFMYDDITLPAMMQIVWHVLQENIGNFLPVSGTTSTVQ